MRVALHGQGHGRRRWRPWFGPLLFAGALLLTLGWGGRWMRAPLSASIPWSTVIYDQDGQLLRLTLASDDKYRVFTPLAQFPSELKEAILFKEDRYFRQHWGINPAALVHAFRRTYLVGGRRIGGSTISMQLARLKYHLVSRSLSGKLNQIWHTLWLEALYSKDEIFEAYLNLLPYGSNVEGAGSASLIYFGKKPQRLNIPEVLTLAVIPQSPHLRTVGLRGEILASHRLRVARDELFVQWRAEHPEAEKDRLSLKLPFAIHGTHDLPFLAPHFTDDLLHQRHKATSAGASVSPVLQTTIRRRQQRLLEQRLAQYVQRQNALGIHNASALLVDWTTMEVKASVGSADFFNSAIEGQVNGTQASRSPGSTLKPFAYGLAFDQGLIHTQSILKDAPRTFAGFDPENFDHDFQGPISAEQALVRSRNLPAVQVAAELAHPNFYEFLHAVGIQNMREPEYYGLSPILGGLEVTMEDLVRLYAMLANHGELRALKKLQSAGLPRVEGRFLSREASQMVLEILKLLPRPQGGSKWASQPVTVAWKTGTSQAFRDAWTVGIFGRYVLAVWLGNFDGASNPALIGRDMAAPLFFELMEALAASERLTIPASSLAGGGGDGNGGELNLKQVKVCAASGQLPGPHCHHTKWTWFIPGRSPIATCDIHREIVVSPGTGLRLCSALANEGRPTVFEFWPSDLLKLFAQAGLPRAAPPAWDPRCRMGDLAGQGAPPKITSPKAGLVYSVRATEDSAQQISLTAIADADVTKEFWFIDETYVGQARPRDPLLWTPKPGMHDVRVVDDQGRSDSQRLQVQVVQ